MKKIKLNPYIAFLWVTIVIVSIIRYRLISVPFERDEGEYAYIGNLFLHGVAPFKSAYTMKLPGTPFMYAIFMLIFGHSDSGVHLGLLFMNAATMYFLFNAFKKIFNSFIGLATSAIYGFMAVSTVFYGFAAHATHFICFFSSIAFLFFAEFMKSGKVRGVFLSGLLLGIAFLMKQQAFFLVLFGAVFLFFYLKTKKKQSLSEITNKILLFGLGVIIPYSIVLLIILFTGQFKVFWLWTVEYAFQYEHIKGNGSLSIMETICDYFKRTFLPTWSCFYYFWILAIGGMAVLAWSSCSRSQKFFAILYFIASGCIVCAGFYFRPHYFIVILPAIGLFTGIFIEFISKQIKQLTIFLESEHEALIILSVVLLFAIYINRLYYFTYPPEVVCDKAYWQAINPFNEAKEIANYVHDNTTDSDMIGVLGSEPEIYFYADRKAATGYLYTFPLLEQQPYNEVMQEEMIREIEKNKPAYLLFCPFSWNPQPGVPQTILQWAEEYSAEKYTQVKTLAFLKNSGWNFISMEDLKNLPTQPESFILILKRKPESK